MPVVRRTRATLRRAEFGFFGVWVYTRTQTPRRWGEPRSAGALDFARAALRPRRTNCWMVGKTSPKAGFDPRRQQPAGLNKTMSIPKSHYFEARPAVPSRPRLVRLKTADIDLQLQADRGVFGSRGVDLGTLVLLREAPAPPDDGDLLDLGSGYGPIA